MWHRCRFVETVASADLVYATHGNLICTRHARWIGGLPFDCAASDQFSLHGCGDILAAHRRHRRLIGHRGRQTVRGRFYDAFDSMSHWRRWDIVTSDPGIAARRTALGIHADEAPYTAKDLATWYPNIVALTELFLYHDIAITQRGLRDRDLLDAGLHYVAEHVVKGLRPSGAADPYLHARRTPPLPLPTEVE